MVGASYTVVKQQVDFTALDTLEILGVFIIAIVALGIINFVVSKGLEE